MRAFTYQGSNNKLLIYTYYVIFHIGESSVIEIQNGVRTLRRRTLRRETLRRHVVLRRRFVKKWDSTARAVCNFVPVTCIIVLELRLI